MMSLAIPPVKIGMSARLAAAGNRIRNQTDSELAPQVLRYYSTYTLYFLALLPSKVAAIVH